MVRPERESRGLENGCVNVNDISEFSPIGQKTKLLLTVSLATGKDAESHSCSLVLRKSAYSDVLEHMYLRRLGSGCSIRASRPTSSFTS